MLCYIVYIVHNTLQFAAAWCFCTVPQSCYWYSAPQLLCGMAPHSCHFCTAPSAPILHGTPQPLLAPTVALAWHTHHILHGASRPLVCCYVAWLLSCMAPHNCYFAGPLAPTPRAAMLHGAPQLLRLFYVAPHGYYAAWSPPYQMVFRTAPHSYLWHDTPLGSLA